MKQLLLVGTKIVFALAVAFVASFESSAEEFLPDREFFFEQCGTIQHYRQISGEHEVTKDIRRKLSVAQSQTINEFFDVWEAMGGSDKRHLAYTIATGFYETAFTLEPIREARSCALDEACREEKIGRSYAKADSNGQRYYGRGFVQLTHRKNYLYAGEQLGRGEDFVENPDLVLDQSVATKILFYGLAEGWFVRGNTLSKYFDDKSEDWVNARRIVNPGSGRKERMAAYGKQFDNCLREKE